MRVFVLMLMCSFVPWVTARDTIPWQPWSAAAFTQAKQQDRMILIDVGMEGCTACRNMDEITYRDPSVVALVRKHFVAIQVDAEARPDIGERYSDWAWPATIFLLPDTTQVLALRGNRLPKNFIPLLNDLLAQQQRGELTADSTAPYAAAPAANETPLSQLRDQLRTRLDAVITRDGFGSTSGARIQQAFVRAHMNDDSTLRQQALLAADGYLHMLDKVWGGVFVAALPDGRQIPEKRISNQANALNVFAEALQVSGDTRFADGIAEVQRYLRSQLLSPEGGFYTSQEDEPESLPPNVDRAAYWRMSDRERSAIGLPITDHAVYTDKNGEVIAALARAYEATGDRTLLELGSTQAQRLLATRLTESGWLRQAQSNALAAQDRRMRPMALEERPFLAAQAYFGSALLVLYRVSGDETWLKQATALARATQALLLDATNGGFFATVPDDAAAFVAPRKPLEANARMAHFLYDLSVYTKEPQFAELARSAIAGSASSTALQREGKVTGELALALEKITSAYVEFSVVGNPADPRAQGLFVASLNTYHPRKLLHYELPGRYPDRDRPALYICNPDLCSLPIEDPAQVAEQSQRMRAGATSL